MRRRFPWRNQYQPDEVRKDERIRGDNRCHQDIRRDGPAYNNYYNVPIFNRFEQLRRY